MHGKLGWPFITVKNTTTTTTQKYISTKTRHTDNMAWVNYLVVGSIHTYIVKSSNIASYGLTV